MAMVADPIPETPLLQDMAASPRLAEGEDRGKGSPVHHYIGATSPSATGNQKGEKEATLPLLPELAKEQPEEAAGPGAQGQGGDAAEAVATSAVTSTSSEQVRPRRQTSFAGPALAAHSYALAKSSKDMLVSIASLSRADIWSALNMRFENWQALRLVADALGVSPAFVAAAVVSGVLGFLLFGLGGSLICAVVGCLYPAFESYKAVETNDMEAMRFWMTYWIVYAIMSSVECALYYVIVNLPFYYPMKLAALMWLCSYSTGGSKYLYMLCVAPTFGAYRQRIDDALEQSRDSIKQGIRDAATKALETSIATGNLGKATLVRSISGAGVGVGAMARIAVMAVKSRKGSASMSEVAENEVATPSITEAAPEESADRAGVSDGFGPGALFTEEAQKSSTADAGADVAQGEAQEPAGEEAPKSIAADAGVDGAHDKEEASHEDDGLAVSPPCFRGPEVAAKAVAEQ